MKTFALILGVAALALLPGCGSKPVETALIKLDEATVVDTACGQCQLGLKGKKGCDLAIRHVGTGYFVDGFKMEDLGGDMHASDGLCTIVRKAKVAGQIADGRFTATSFELLPLEKP